jgi:hypothetical protein
MIRSKMEINIRVHVFIVLCLLLAIAFDIRVPFGCYLNEKPPGVRSRLNIAKACHEGPIFFACTRTSRRPPCRAFTYSCHELRSLEEAVRVFSQPKPIRPVFKSEVSMRALHAPDYSATCAPHASHPSSTSSKYHSNICLQKASLSRLDIFASSWEPGGSSNGNIFTVSTNSTRLPRSQ